MTPTFYPLPDSPTVQPELVDAVVRTAHPLTGSASLEEWLLVGVFVLIVGLLLVSIAYIGRPRD